jgi:hypothetical protein
MNYGGPISRLAPLAVLSAGLFVADSVGGWAPASAEQALVFTGDAGCGVSTSSVPFSLNASRWGPATQRLRTSGCGSRASARPKAHPAATVTAVPQWQHQGRLVPFDPPGSAKVVSAACGSGCGTQALGINSSAVVVGYYTDAYVVPHAFVRRPDGRSFSFDGPGAGLGHGLNEGTDATGITSDFTIVGNVETPGLTVRGYIRDPRGGYTMIDAPGAGQGDGLGTYAISINDKGETAGYDYEDANGSRGFVRSPRGVLSSFSPPGAVYTFVSALNSAGEIDGTYIDASNGYHGFVREPSGVIATVDAPGAGTGVPQHTLGTRLNGINDAGVSVGFFSNIVNSQYVYHAIARYPNGSISVFHSENSSITAIDSAEAITGFYAPSRSAPYRGFARSANGELATFSPPAAGTGFDQGTVPLAINAREAVTGFWVDADNLNHGFIWTPR